MGSIKLFLEYLLKFEIFLVTGAIAVSMLFTNLLPYALVAVGIFWIIRWIAWGYPSNRTPADLPIFLIAVMGIVTLWATALPEVTYTQVYRLLIGIGFYFSVINWTNSLSRLRFLLIGLSVAGIGLAFLGLFSVEWTTYKVPFMPDFIYDYIPTLFSDVIHRNVMAGTLVILIPVLVGVLLHAWKEIKTPDKVVFIASALIMIFILVLTQSRAGWMAFGLSMATIALMGKRWSRLLLLVGMIFGIFLIIFIGIDPFFDAIIASNTIGGIDGRIETWSRALYMIQDYPFTGIGMGSFLTIADTLYPFLRLGFGSVPHAHNLFFQIGVDLGLPGLIGWFAILLIILLDTWRLYRKVQNTESNVLSGLGAGLFCSQIALCSHGTLDAVTWGMVRPAPIVWALWGLAIAGSLISVKHTIQP